MATRAVRVSVGLAEDQASLPIYRAYVQGAPDEGELRRILGPGAVVTDAVAEGKVWFSRAASLGDIVAAVGRMRALAGVDDVKLILSKQTGVAYPHLEAWCREAAQATGGAPAPPPSAII